MSEDEVWLNDDVLKLSDEEFVEFLRIHGSTPQWQQCPIGVLGSLRAVGLRLILCAVFKRFLVFAYAKGLINELIVLLSIVASGLFIIATQNNFILPICTYIALIAVLPYFKFLFNKHFGFVMLIYSISLLLVWQYIFTAEEFMSMRGILMIVLMKITSLSFDLANEIYTDITLLHLFSYLLDSSTVIFGPWSTYRQFKDSLYTKGCKVEIADSFRALAYIAMSLFFVIYSSCVADSFTELSFVGAYFVAQSFRFSHYFISWCSAGASLLCGISSGVVAEWVCIEWPRSLVDVVISWNIPMHRFLHQYIFAEIRKYGSAVAIFITYAVSSLLHGINFQLSAVLLSLGLYTYAETTLRNKLSRRLNSCVRARKCPKECQHLRKEDALSTFVINTAFRILAVIHLIYLGMVFDDSAAETGYSWKHTLTVWANSYYYSHLIGLLTLFMSFIV